MRGEINSCQLMIYRLHTNAQYTQTKMATVTREVYVMPTYVHAQYTQTKMATETREVYVMPTYVQWDRNREVIVLARWL